MSTRKTSRRTPAKRTTSRTPAKRTTTRRRTTRKRGLGDLMTRNEAQAGFNQLLGVAAGYAGAAALGKFLNPEGENHKREIFVKMVGGFLISTTARMPNVGAGVMANAVGKLIEVNAGLGDAGFLNDLIPGKKQNYLSSGRVVSTGIYMGGNSYQTGYQSTEY